MTPAEREALLDEAVNTAIANAGGAGYHFLSGASVDDLQDGDR